MTIGSHTEPFRCRDSGCPGARGDFSRGVCPAGLGSACVGTAFAQNSARASQGIWGAVRGTTAGGSAFGHAPMAAAPATHFRSGPSGGYWAGQAARPGYSAPAYRAPSYSAPRYATPSFQSFGGYQSSPSYGGGWGRSSPSYSAPRSFGRGFGGAAYHSFGAGYSGSFRGGGFSGGGFHGGGFGGGGHR